LELEGRAVVEQLAREGDIRFIIQFLNVKTFDLVNQVDLVNRFHSLFTCFRAYKMLKTTEAKTKFYALTFRRNFWSEELKSIRRKEK
jgi:hypothetical protein